MKPGKELLEVCLIRMNRDQLDQLVVNCGLTLDIEGQEHVYVGDGMVKGSLGISEFSVSKVVKWSIPDRSIIPTVEAAEQVLDEAKAYTAKKALDAVKSAEVKAQYAEEQAKAEVEVAEAKAVVAREEADRLAKDNIPDPKTLPWLKG